MQTSLTYPRRVELESENPIFLGNISIGSWLRANWTVTIWDYGDFILEVNASGYRQDNGLYVEKHETVTVKVDKLRILSPQNQTYTINTIPLTFIVVQQPSWIGFNFNNLDNVTITGNTTLMGLPQGSYTVRVYTNYTSGDMESAEVSFTINFPSPKITILNPQNRTYSKSNLSLTFTLDLDTEWIGFSLDNMLNTTITGNSTLIEISEGLHQITVYARSLMGVTGASETVSFTVDTTPPNITMITQDPSEDVSLGDLVTINARVVDSISGVRWVILNYTVQNENVPSWNETFRILNMTNIEDDLWNATIPSYPYGSNVTYCIQASDNAGNIISSQGMGYKCQYSVIPEFHDNLSLLLIFSAIMTFIIIRKSKPLFINSVPASKSS